MRIDHVGLTDFRNYVELEVDFSAGLTVVLGPNGHGKTNLLEAVGFLATLGSFRGAPNEHLVRSGCAQAVIRATGVRNGRFLDIRAEIPCTGRARVTVNGQRLQRVRDLVGVMSVTVFGPGDLDLIKEGPALRRDFLDTTLVALDARNDAVCREVERILRQRASLLRQCAGRLSPETELTLDVWDDKLAPTAELLGRSRAALVADLEPLVAAAYTALAGMAGMAERVALRYQAPWLEGGLVVGLRQARSMDLARAVTTVGPHRDELLVELGGMTARGTASQGEQRCLALALKLAAHQLVTERQGAAPVLLLDDVFSELDPARSAALLANLPAGQTLLTSAERLPVGTQPERIFRVVQGHLAEVGPDGGSAA